MPTLSRSHYLVTFLLVCSSGTVWPVPAQSAGTDAGAPSGAPHESQPALPTASVPKPPLDRSGHKRVGKASVYANKFVGKKMADGTTMHSHGDSAASKTLPLGTTAEVTNLKTGKSAVVTIRDRGPYVKGRIIDLTPSTAKKIGIEETQGVSKVEVAPITVPQGDGSTKPGAGDKEPK
ncbi:MAG: septal ring lytic transglycosylase RlpA family protein [Pseudomonadota bacterium]|nr:septal ring lytic transglycosylase RlpA family protein [Pseudomonadota bacterium]